jgi:hypothetical protein
MMSQNNKTNNNANQENQSSFPRKTATIVAIIIIIILLLRSCGSVKGELEPETGHQCCNCNHAVEILEPITGEPEPTVEPTVVPQPTAAPTATPAPTAEPVAPVPTAEPVPEHVHVFGKWEVVVKPSCEEEGIEVRKCACGATEEKAVKAKGHTAEAISAVEPSCTQSGLTEGAKCADCQKVLEKQNPVKALGHDWQPATPSKPETCSRCGLTRGDKVHTCKFGSWRIAKKATCTENGLKVRECTCGEKEEEILPAVGHTEIADKAVAATCTQTGLTAGKHCSTCGTVLVKQNVVPAKGHKEVTIAGKAATCTESGSTNGAKCSVCGTTIKAQSAISALGHDWAPATYDKPETCRRCGLTRGSALVKPTPTPAPHVHAWGNWFVIEPGCDYDGLKVRHCECGEHDEHILAAKGHNWQPATYEAPKTCSVCGKTEGSKLEKPSAKPAAKPEATPAPHNHRWSNATCTESAKCECGATKGSALGHSWTEATTEAPKTCTRCGATEGAALPKHEHSFSKPTCTEAGKCSCGATGNAATGHSWTEATYTAPKTCKTCGATEGSKLTPVLVDRQEIESIVVIDNYQYRQIQVIEKWSDGNENCSVTIVPIGPAA